MAGIETCHDDLERALQRVIMDETVFFDITSGGYDLCERGGAFRQVRTNADGYAVEQAIVIGSDLWMAVEPYFKEICGGQIPVRLEAVQGELANNLWCFATIVSVQASIASAVKAVESWMEFFLQ